MKVQNIKLDVLQKTMRVKELPVLKKIVKILDKEVIVGYSYTGKQLALKEYNYRLMKE